MGRPRRIVINKVLTDKETSNLEGQWFDESYMKHPLINLNVDDNKSVSENITSRKFKLLLTV